MSEEIKDKVQLIRVSTEAIKTPQQDLSFTNRATCQRRS
jgi:hypothetical protein